MLYVHDNNINYLLTGEPGLGVADAPLLLKVDSGYEGVYLNCGDLVRCRR